MESVKKRTRVRARELRREMTPAEEALWERLRDRQILGLKFRRQTPIDRYIPDFCCPELRLVVEVDGEVHEADSQAEHDRNRDAYLRSLGYLVLRFSNEQVLTESRSVLRDIEQAARSINSRLPESVSGMRVPK
jgi:very-short-patch-repair endonuclease